MKLTEAEQKRLAWFIAERQSDQGMPLATLPEFIDLLLVERKADKAKIERWGILIDGALANTYGPYSDKELLRRVTEILRHATREEQEEEKQ